MENIVDKVDLGLAISIGAILVALGSAAIAVYALYAARGQQAVSKRLLANQLLRDAWNLMGGKSGTENIVEFASQSNLAQAKRLIDEALVQDSGSSLAYRRLASYHAGRKEYQESIDALQTAVKLEPKDSHGHYNLGKSYYRLEHYDKALEAFKAAIGLNPQWAEAHYYLGNTYDKLERDDEALAAFKTVIELDPENEAAHRKLGNTYFGSKQYDEAIKAFQAIIDLDPNNALAYYNLGLSCTNLKHYGDAVKAFKATIRLDPENTLARENLKTAEYLVEHL